MTSLLSSETASKFPGRMPLVNSFGDYLPYVEICSTKSISRLDKNACLFAVILHSKHSEV